MFQFKFLKDPTEAGEGEPSASSESSSKTEPCEELSVSEFHHEITADLDPAFASLQDQGFPLKYLRPSELIKSPVYSAKASEDVRNILNSSSDLVSGVYEGGFKLWECTFDLLSYLEKNSGEIGFDKGNLKVLDLGCGFGLLGLYALSKGSSVMFQDYNKEVLNFLTIPNVISNFKQEGASSSRFVGGSWTSLREKVESGDIQDFKFDVILSSETIYNLEYMKDFIKLLELGLKEDGVVFVAAKTYYFGVGGGTKTFASLARKSNMQVETVHVVKEGVQREILRVQKIS